MPESARSTGKEGAPENGAGDVVPISDRVLLQRYVDGDAHAFRELMQLYATPIYGYLTRAGLGSDRDDVFQDIFCSVHLAARDNPPRGALKPWLFAIAVNAVRSHFRKGRVRAVVVLKEDAGSSVAHGDPSPSERVEAAETASWIEAQIAALPLDLREALILCRIDGMSVEDAAEVLDAPVNTVKTRVRRARIVLAEAHARRDRTFEREVAQ
jgi:RNA polymerase sigma-70 factor (ECF subfamily)